MSEINNNTKPRPSVLLITMYFCVGPARQQKYNLLLRALSPGLRIHVISQADPGAPAEDEQSLPYVEFHVYRYFGYALRKLYLALKKRRWGKPASGDACKVSWTHSVRGWALKQLDHALNFAKILPFPDAYLFSIARGEQLAARLIEKGEGQAMISACFPYSNLAIGLRLKRRYPDVKWVVEMRDAFASTPTIKTTRLWRRLARRLERQVFEKADQVWIYRNWFPGGLRYFEHTYPDLAHKVIELPYCGYDEDLFAPCRQSQQRNTNEMRIVHAGHFYRGEYTPVAFLQALAELRSDGNLPKHIRVDFYGGGQEHWHLVESLQLGDLVKHHAFVPYARIAQVLCDADLLMWLNGRMVDDEKAGGYEDNLPSKLFDYIGSGNSILAIAGPGAGRQLIEADGLGYLAEPGNVPSVKAALLMAIKDWQDGTMRVGRRNLRDFSVQNQLCEAQRQLADLLETEGFVETKSAARTRSA